MESRKTLIANFSQQITLTTIASPLVGGTLTGAGVYTSGDTAVVTATPNASYIFNQWFGDCTGTGLCTVIMDTDKTVTADFLQQQFALTTVADPSAGGTLTGAGVYGSGDIAIVTATPSAGFTFDRWSGACSGTGGCTVMMDSSKTVTANFIP